MPTKLPPYFLHDRKGQTLPTRDIGRGLEVQHGSWAIVTASRELAIGRPIERAVILNPESKRKSKTPALVWLTAEEYAQAVAHGRLYRVRMDRARLALQLEKAEAERAVEVGPAEALPAPPAALTAEYVRALVREEIGAAALRVMTTAFNEPMQAAPVRRGNDRADVVAYMMRTAKLVRAHAAHPTTDAASKEWHEGYASGLAIVAHEIRSGFHEGHAEMDE